MRASLALLSGVLLIARIAFAYAENVAVPDPTPGQAIVNAAALKPIPDEALAVKPWDNSDANMALAKEIEDRLKAHGYRIDPQSTLVLSFETEADTPSGNSDPRRRIIELQGHTGSSNDDDANVMLNLYSSDKGGVLNDRNGASDAPVAPAHHLKMTLDGQARGQTPARGRLWQGEASGRPVGSDEQTLYRAMVGPLVENIGLTVRAQPYSLK